MHGSALLLGVDGGGTKCRARLCAADGTHLGEGLGGPANLRLGLEESFAAVADASTQCLDAAGLGRPDATRITACLALAGARAASGAAAPIWRRLGFRHVMVTTDARAACVGAHEGRDGGVVIIGTGTIGACLSGGRFHQVGGWGFPLSDEGSGAWLGFEALRSLWLAHDGRADWSPLLRAIFDDFGRNPDAIVNWMTGALPRDYAGLAPLVIEYAGRSDPLATDIVRRAAAHIASLVTRLAALGCPRLSLFGGLAPRIEPWLLPGIRRMLVEPAGDALSGAIRLAREEAQSMAGAP